MILVLCFLELGMNELYELRIQFMHANINIVELFIEKRRIWVHFNIVREELDLLCVLNNGSFHSFYF